VVMEGKKRPPRDWGWAGFLATLRAGLGTDEPYSRERMLPGAQSIFEQFNRL
jgi:hypothetical protein